MSHGCPRVRREATRDRLLVVTTGLMCVGGSFAAFLSPITTGFVIDQTGSWSIPFLVTILLLFVGALLTFFMRPDRAFVSAPSQTDTMGGSLVPSQNAAL